MSIATYDLASLTYDSATTDYDGGGLGLSNMPVVGVFISFTDGPYVVDPNWVEVTQYVRDINVKRGRGNDLQQFPSGSANLTLDNRTRIFDPFNTAGIYYGNLKPRRQIKIVGQWAGVTYPIFRGFIAGWPVGYSDGGKDSTVQIDCFDALGLLASETTLADPLSKYTLSLSPSDYWKLDDISVTTTMKNQVRTDNTMNVADLSTIKNYSSVDSLHKSISGAAASIESINSNTKTLTSGYGVASPIYNDHVMSMNVWIQRGVSTTTDCTAYFYSTSCNLAITVQETAVVASFVSQLQGTAVFGRTNATPLYYPSRDRAGHMYTVTYDLTTVRLYIDGIFVISSALTNIGERSMYDWSNASYGIYQEWSNYNNKVLSASEILTLYQTAILQIPETSTVRENRVMSTSSFSPLLQSFPASPTSTVSELTTDSTIVNDLQKTVISEGGELYVSNTGVLTSTNREYFASIRSAVSQMSFVDIGTGVYYDHAALSMAYDADQVRNSVQLQFSNGGSTVVSDATSIASYGESGESRSTVISDFDGATTLASRLLNLFKNPRLRIDPFMVKGQRNPSYDFPLLLSLELLDRFTFVRTPSTGSAISQDMLLQSIEHRITPGTWETVVNGSARFTGWFIIGTSLIGGTDVLL